MIELLEEKKYLDIISKWEKQHDIMFVATRINRLLKMEEFDDSQMYFTKYIMDRVEDPLFFKKSSDLIVSSSILKLSFIVFPIVKPPLL